MKIGIVGSEGIVGGAAKYGFEKLGHEVIPHDIRLNTKLEDLIRAETIYICVPTPAHKDGSGRCDTTIVESVIEELSSLNYSGIVAIKSTVEPGFTDRMTSNFPSTTICFVPEFLRERAAFEDFINMDLLVVGARTEYVFEIIKQQHGKYPKTCARLNPTEAELCKYFNNIYNATLITFANSFYEVCKTLGADYSAVKNAIVNRDHITDVYLDCNDNFRGFAGMCLPKDTNAIAALMQNTNVEFFKDLLKENAKYKPTVFDGMRP